MRSRGRPNATSARPAIADSAAPASSTASRPNDGKAAPASAGAATELTAPTTRHPVNAAPARSEASLRGPHREDSRAGHVPHAEHARGRHCDDQRVPGRTQQRQRRPHGRQAHRGDPGTAPALRQRAGRQCCQATGADQHVGHRDRERRQVGASERVRRVGEVEDHDGEVNDRVTGGGRQGSGSPPSAMSPTPVPVVIIANARG